MSRAKALSMGDAPFVFNKRTSASLMWGTAAALLPALAWGVFCFGYSALLPVAAAIGGALAGEAVFDGLRRRFTLWDGSAFLTGLLVGMAMPAGIFPLIPAVASLFAVTVVKGAFGGLGSNWMNPALAGIVFALVNWPVANADLAAAGAVHRSRGYQRRDASGLRPPSCPGRPRRFRSHGRPEGGRDEIQRPRRLGYRCP